MSGALDEEGAPAGPPTSLGERLITLDFIRGIAVLGILFANIVAFGHTELAYGWPGGLPEPMDTADTAVWLGQYVLIDGKMRGLFSLLFGAGIGLFMDRAWERGQGGWLQARRLLWLGAFGLLHFFFLFWGDILFLYALAGLGVLPFLGWRYDALIRLGLIAYLAGAIFLAVAFIPTVTAEQGGRAGLMDRQALVEAQAERVEGARVELEAFTKGSYPAEVAYVAREQSSILAGYPFVALFETIPLMLIGMGLYRWGLFGTPRGEGAEVPLDPQRLRIWGWAGVVSGALLSLPLALWALEKGFPPWLTDFVTNNAVQLPHLPMVFGLAVLLAAAAPKASQGWLGSRLVAAGRMAFSNYIGTSVLMMLVFRHWAGAQFGELGRLELLGPMVLAWVLMLAWSKPWLARFRYGPLEWLWRCLTYWRVFPLRR